MAKVGPQVKTTKPHGGHFADGHWNRLWVQYASFFRRTFRSDLESKPRQFHFGTTALPGPAINRAA